MKEDTAGDGRSVTREWTRNRGVRCPLFSGQSRRVGDRGLLLGLPSARSMECQRGKREKSVEANLLNTLLLSGHFLFLLDYFRLVFEREREREANEEGGRGEDPDDIADDLSARPYGSYKA